MKPGDVFNPWHEACDFYPADIVGRQTGKILTHGQKRLYDRLVRYAGRDGRCFPSQERLADDLGISERQVRKDLIRLEAFRLIDRRAREGRRGDTYTFLWHPMFDAFERNCGSGQTGGNEHLTGTLVPLKPGIDGPRPEPNEDLTGTPGSFDRNCGSAYLIKEQKKSSSSPTPSDGGREEDEEIASLKTGERESEDVSELVAFMAETLETSTGKPAAVQPRDAQRTRDKAPSWAVAEIVEGLRKCASTGKPQNVRWFPKVVTDIYDRLDKKPPVVPKRCMHGVIDGLDCRACCDEAKRQRAADLEAQGICPTCENTGTVQSRDHWGDAYRTCKCEFGKAKERKNRDYTERHNVLRERYDALKHRIAAWNRPDLLNFLDGEAFVFDLDGMTEIVAALEADCSPETAMRFQKTERMAS